jgi:hypothetical protein
MSRKILLAAMAAASIVATAGPAAAQGGHRSFHEGWNRGGPDEWARYWSEPVYGSGFAIGPYSGYAAVPGPYGAYGYSYGYAPTWSVPPYREDTGPGISGAQGRP